MSLNPRLPKPSACADCALATSGIGYAPYIGPESARLRFIAEALGAEEVLRGEPLVGAAGGVHSRILHRAGIERDHCGHDNTIRCMPPGMWLDGAPWEHAALGHCRQYLNQTLARVPPDGVVVTLGATALRSVLNLHGVDGIAVKDFHGTVSRDPSDRFWVVPTFHPSHLQRGAMSLLDVCTQDVALASRIATHGFTRSPVQLVVDPHPDWFRVWCADHLTKAQADPDGVHLACDTEFLEKAGGADESEIVAWSAQSPITRINGANDRVTGWTVPYKQPYIRIYDDLLQGLRAVGGWVWFWNKYADVDHLRAAGHALDGLLLIDGMWLWHHIQSDVPRGLGFVAPMASDFGAWKHWGKVKSREAEYAAADGVQTWRTCMWLLSAAQRLGMFDMYMRDWHERDQYCLRPAHEQGVPVDRAALQAFHEELQRKLARVLVAMKETAAQGVLKPKVGYAKRPMIKCAGCGGTGEVREFDVEHDCGACDGIGKLPVTTPPKTILGPSKKGGGEAKSTYMLEGVRLVEREINVGVRVCGSCGVAEVGPKHNCHRKAATKTRRDGDGPDRPPELRTETRPVRRWFWQLPFNPDAPAQILAYLAQQGIAAPIDKKKQRATTNKKALDALKKQHADDPFFQLQLDWKAVQKVDSTYAVGTLARLDGDDRVHPEYAPIPSTLRDSAKQPNLTNCVRAGTLIEVLRDCVVFPKGVPIEQVQIDDWAYTFDASRQLTLRRVTAVHANGQRFVIRVHWRSANKRPAAYVDLTADHAVYLTTGEWKTVGNLRRGDRILSLARCDAGGYEMIVPTGTRGCDEHRWVYLTLHPNEPPPPHTHHKNENKRDNRPDNLEAKTVSEHFRLHNRGAGNPNWRADYPVDPVLRRRAANRDSRARKRAADPEGFLKWQRDSKRAWYQLHRAKRPHLLNNHRVIGLEPLPDPVDVYDLTIDDTHCYIAGELAVHNCVADKAGPQGLAAGFRRCIVARDGVPPTAMAADLAAWESRWGYTP